MFKLESYVAPLLMGYVDAYVKLRPDDLQLSLWGGDVTLSKLELRLDTLQKALPHPVALRSGHIHELRLHVPWTRLGYEPVIVTINTIECVLTLDGHACHGDAPTTSSSTTPPPATTDEDIPPGYLQSLINRIVNNVNVVVNNLILKFVDDDVVLSVNVKSAECYSVGDDWTRCFVDAANDAVLKRVVDVHDLTVCLDRRDASGHIGAYQDPLLYRCSLECRLSRTSRPRVTRLSVLCGRLELSLTDVQAPMFSRLLQLVIAVYYGTLPASSMDSRDETSLPPPPSHSAEMKTEEPAPVEEDGWGSWAWSFVPQILPTEEELQALDVSNGIAASTRKSGPAITEIGLYASKAVVLFKSTEIHSSSTSSGPHKVAFWPYAKWEAEGIALDVLMKGVGFFDAMFAISSMRMSCLGEASSQGMAATAPSADSYFLSIGTNDEPHENKSFNFLSGSLFDSSAADVDFITDEQRHLETYTETYVQQRFGAFFFDYLFTADEEEEEENDSIGDVDTNAILRENSAMRFIFCPGEILISSAAVQRVQRLIFYICDHSYEPIGSTAKEDVDADSRVLPTSAEMQALEAYSPTRSYQLVILQPSIRILTANLPPFDPKRTKTQRKHRKPKTTASSAALPAIAMRATSISVQLHTAMYPRQVALVTSKMAVPSDDLLHRCHSHMHLQLYGVQCGLTLLQSNGTWATEQTVINPFSMAMYRRCLLCPKYWTDTLRTRTEVTYELATVKVTLSPCQLLIFSHVLLCWWLSTPPRPSRLLSHSLVADAFHPATSRPAQPVLELSITDVQLTQCYTGAISGITATVSSIQASVTSKAIGRTENTPLLYAPLDTSSMFDRAYFSQPPPCLPSEGLLNSPCFAMTLQIPHDALCPLAPAVFFVEVSGIVGCVDPILYDWLSYSPRRYEGDLSARSTTTTSGVLDSILSRSALPLKDHPHNSAASLSAGTVTAPTDSQTGEPLMSVTPGSNPPSKHSVGPSQGHDDGSGGWGEMLAGYFPLLRVMEVQVSLASCCVFAPTQHVFLVEPTLNIAANLRAAHQGPAGLPPTLVMCCPLVKVVSSGHVACNAVHELPVHALEHAVAGEKLPLSVNLRDASVYTLHQAAHYMLKPLSASVTLAVSSKYSPPTSDDISALGLCVHTDMGAVEILVSQHQLQLLSQLGTRLVQLSSVVRLTLESQHRLYRPSVTPEPRQQAPPPAPSLAAAAAPLQDAPVESSSGFVVPHTPLLTSETSDSMTSASVADAASMTTGSVAMSLWLQWTIPCCMTTFYGESPTTKELIRVRVALDDLTAAIDVQEVYLKIKCNVGAANVAHHAKNTHDGWQPGSYAGILLSSSENFRRDVCVACPHSVHPTSPSSVDKDALPPLSPGRDKGHGFIRATFTSALRRDFLSRIGRTSSTHDLSWVSEICLDLSPCDFVMNCGVVATLISAMASVLPATATRGADTPQQQKQPSQPFTLPLVHVTANKWRLLLPAGDDVMVACVSSVCLAPQADNPLPRVGLKAGVRAGVEDKQFQLDVIGLSVSTGSWRHLVVNVVSDENETTVQNPAVEWNNMNRESISGEHVVTGFPYCELEQPQLLPLVMNFDLRVVFAPAIVDSNIAKQAAVVCGSSLEVNATSNVDLLISAAQIHLISTILADVSSLASSFQPAVATATVTSTADVTLDSGVASDASTLRSPASKNTQQVAAATVTSAFDALLTARRISVIVYRSTAEIDCMASDSMKTSSEVGGGGNAVLPLLYAEFSQPHVVLACRDAVRKAEMSCYDVVLKGVKKGYHFYEEEKLLPDVVDFSHAWLVTRPGQAHRQTGIPPCLYTLNFVLPEAGPAKFSIRLERPLKVNLSLCMVDQVLDFAKIVFSGSDANNDDTDGSSAIVAPPSPESSGFFDLLNEFDAQLTTVQLVVSMETEQTACSAAVQWSVSSVGVDVTATCKAADYTIIASISLSDHLVRTSYDNQWRTLLAPVRIATDVSCHCPLRDSGGGGGDSPRLLVVCEVGPLEVRLGQEQWLTCVSLTEQVSKFIQDKSSRKSTTSGVSADAAVATPRKVEDDHTDVDCSTDDLRTGEFEYTFDKSGTSDALPAPNDIMFGTDDRYGHAILSWQYASPRVVTHIEVTPVPFSLPAGVTEEVELEVRCVLEQYNALRGWFEFYSEFTLSPGQCTTLQLPAVVAGMNPSIVPTSGWRVVILHPADQQRFAHLFEQDSPDGAMCLEPVVSAETLAGSIRVDSSSAPHAIPTLQACISIDTVELHCVFHPNQLSNVTPKALQPFSVAPPRVNEEEFLMLALKKTMLAGSYLQGVHQQMQFQLETRLSVDVLEYRHLTMRPLVDDTDIELNVSQKGGERMKVDMHVHATRMHVGQLALHTLTGAGDVWQQILASDRNAKECVLMNYYLICNDTSESLRIGQVDTEESVVIASRHLVPFAWKSTSQKQLLRVSLASSGWSWTSGVSPHDHGTSVLTVEKRNGQSALLVVSVSAYRGLQRKIVIRGELTVISRLHESLEVSCDRCQGDTANLQRAGSLPSWVVARGSGPQTACIRVRVARPGQPEMQWSHDFTVVGSKVKHTRLVKIPLDVKSSFLHVWCHVFKRDHAEGHQTLVLLSPVFVVQSQLPSPLLMNITTPGVHDSQQVVLAGRGQERPLQVAGGDTTHHVTFQVNADREASVPSLSLSSGTIDQLDRTSLDVADTESLMRDSWSEPTEPWPYNQLGQQMPCELTPPVVTTGLPPGDDHIKQANIDLQINLSERWPGCKTLLIDVAPYWLFVNETAVDLTVVEGDRPQWSASSHCTVAPPVIQGCFRVGLVAFGSLHFSGTLELSDEDRSSRFLPQVEGRLYRNSHMPVAVPVKHDGRLQQVCYLTLHSCHKGALHVVTVREKFVICNRTGFDMTLRCISLPLHENESGCAVDTHMSHQVLTPSDRDSLLPLLCWYVPTSSEASTHDECVHYISISTAAGCHDDKDETWSVPARLRVTEEGSRGLVAVPRPNGRGTHAVAVCVAAEQGRCYLMLSMDESPAMIVYNNCAFPLHVAQQMPPDDKSGVATREELELTGELPTIHAFAFRHYAFPDADRTFPRILQQPESRRILLAKFSSTDVVWSYGIDVETEHDVFVSIPSDEGATIDVKVHVEKVAQTSHVFVDPVSRAEVSAREIRSRIHGRDTLVELVTPASVRSSASAHAVTETCANSAELCELSDMDGMVKGSLPFDLKVSCEQIVLSIVDEWSRHDCVTDMLDVTADGMTFHAWTEMSTRQHERVSAILQHASLTVADLQLDNQMYGRGNYDFAVVLPGEGRSHDTSLPNFLAFNLVGSAGIMHSGWDEVAVTLRPIAVYIDDVFIRDLLSVLGSWVLETSDQPSSSSSSSSCYPPPVLHALATPLRLSRVTVSVPIVVASVHASLALFLASDAAPLRFSDYHRHHLLTTPDRLARDLLTHYARAVLSRAGWVIGSLDLLGSPTGLLRSAGSGLSDLVRLPCSAISHGPMAFVGGLTHGMFSLVRNVSAGTLTSVTNFASSVSRNMDRLSLDVEHRERQEMSRRLRPLGVGEGLRNGLSGFGLSMLGAVAGLADHPLQSLSASPSGPGIGPSPVGAAVGLAGGVGRGLLGVVTKPIGGTAEFVSQFGTGLLEGAGLGRQPSRRRMPSNHRTSAFSDSRLKYLDKLLYTVDNCTLVTCAVADQWESSNDDDEQQQDGRCCHLLLTTDALYVVVGEQQERAFAVCEIDCRPGSDEYDDHVIFVVPQQTDSAPWEKEKFDRVACYVGSEPQSEVKNEDGSQVEKAHVRYEYHVSRLQRELFLSHFRVLKHNLGSFGFVI